MCAGRRGIHFPFKINVAENRLVSNLNFEVVSLSVSVDTATATAAVAAAQ